jgi:hypothetical protein
VLADERVVGADPLDEPVEAAGIERDAQVRLAAESERIKAVARALEEPAVQVNDVRGALDDPQIPVRLERTQLCSAKLRSGMSAIAMSNVSPSYDVSTMTLSTIARQSAIPGLRTPSWPRSRSMIDGDMKSRTTTRARPASIRSSSTRADAA